MVALRLHRYGVEALADSPPQVGVQRVTYEAAIDTPTGGALRLHRYGVEAIATKPPIVAVQRTSYEAAIDTPTGGALRLHRMGIEVLLGNIPEVAVQRMSYEAAIDTATGGAMRLHRFGIELLAKTGVPDPVPIPLASGIEFFLHNWAERVDIETSYVTDVTRSPDTLAEQRRSLVQRPERTMSVTWNAVGDTEIYALQLLMDRFTKENLHVPLYPDIAWLTSPTAAPDTTIFGNFKNKRFYAGARVVIFRTDEPFGKTYLPNSQATIRTIESLTADSLTLTATIGSVLPTYRTAIVPLIDCEILLEPELLYLTDEVATMQATFRELKGRNGLPPSAVGFPEGWNVQLGRPVFEIEPNWVQGVKTRYKRYGSENRQGRRLLPSVDGDRPARVQDWELAPLERPDYFKVCAMFDSRRGRALSFWAIDREFQLKVLDTDPTFIDVQPFGTFANFNQLWTEQNIGAGIVMKDGFVHVVQINTVIDNGSTWRLTVTAGQLLPDPIDVTQIDHFARARISRYDTDVMRETWVTDNVANVRLTTVEVMNEKNVDIDP